jgi:RimK family alpha-L-glutamate ligase
MKKIVVFTLSLAQSKYEVGRLKEEAIKTGVEIKHCLYKDLRFEFNDGGEKVYIKGVELDFENIAGVWFRVAGTPSGKYITARNNLIEMPKKRDVFCVNHESYLRWARMAKIIQHGVFVRNNIPVVPTKVFYKKKELVKNKFEYPVIAKQAFGFQGKSVVKIDNKEEMKSFIYSIEEKDLGLYLWQDFLPVGWDIRVVVVGGKAIGGMKRSAVGGEFRSNFSLGGKVEEWKLSKEEIELAERTARVCGLDYGGVDIMKDLKGNDYVLEVNRACQYKGFEKATGINVAKRVLEMLVGSCK